MGTNVPSPEKNIRMCPPPRKTSEAGCSGRKCIIISPSTKQSSGILREWLEDPKRVMNFATRGSNLKPLATRSQPHFRHPRLKY
jgi:hypothetical protein